MNEATHDYIRTTVYIAPFTALIPPNNVHNVATLLTPEDDHNTIFYFIAWNGADKPGIDADAWRKFNVLQWGVDVDREFRRQAHARQPLRPGSRRDEGGKLHRHQRHPEPGYRHVGMDGPDQRPLQGAGRRQRRGGGGVPPPDGGMPRAPCAKADRRSARRAAHPHATISSYEGVVPKTTNWRSLGGGSEAPLERVREAAK